MGVSNAVARELFGPQPPPIHHPLMCALLECSSTGVEVARDAPAVSGATVLVSAQPLFDKRGTRMGAVANLRAPVDELFSG